MLLVISLFCAFAEFSGMNWKLTAMTVALSYDNARVTYT